MAPVVICETCAALVTCAHCGRPIPRPHPWRRFMRYLGRRWGARRKVATPVDSDAWLRRQLDGLGKRGA
jgi:hypothetical protein